MMASQIMMFFVFIVDLMRDFDFCDGKTHIFEHNYFFNKNNSRAFSWLSENFENGSYQL